MNTETNDLEPETIESLDLKKKKLEVAKLEKENRKLEIEQAELIKAWYKKSAWWSVVVPFLIGLAGVYVAFSTNIFGLQKLQNEKDILNNTIKNKQDSITVAGDSLQELKNTIAIAIESNKQRMNSLKGENNELIKFNEYSKKNTKQLKKIIEKNDTLVQMDNALDWLELQLNSLKTEPLRNYSSHLNPKTGQFEKAYPDSIVQAARNQEIQILRKKIMDLKWKRAIFTAGLIPQKIDE